MPKNLPHANDLFASMLENIRNKAFGAQPFNPVNEPNPSMLPTAMPRQPAPMNQNNPSINALILQELMKPTNELAGGGGGIPKPPLKDLE